MRVPNWWVVLQQFARPGLAVLCVCVCAFTGVRSTAYFIPCRFHTSRAQMCHRHHAKINTTGNFWDAKSLVTEVTSCSGVLAGKLTVAHMVSLFAYDGTRIFLLCHIYLNVSFDATYLLLPVLPSCLFTSCFFLQIRTCTLSLVTPTNTQFYNYAYYY